MLAKFNEEQKSQRFSNYKYTFDEFVDAMRDPVINHYYFGKMQG